MKRYKFVKPKMSSFDLNGHTIRVSESDVAIDLDLKALYKAVENLETKERGSAERFAKIIQTKYGITSTDNLKKSMSMWLKIPIGGLSIAGFAGSIYGAIAYGLKLYRNINECGIDWVAKHLNSMGYYSTHFLALSVVCITLSFVFANIFKYIINFSNKTESTNPYYKQKTILESEIFINKICQFIESDAGDPVVKLNVTADKSNGICRRMFNWIKDKVSEGWAWIKKHPYITIALLIVIGCVFYYIHMLRGQIAGLNNTVGELNSRASELQNDISKLKDANSVLSNKNSYLNKNIRTSMNSDDILSNKIHDVSSKLFNITKEKAKHMYDFHRNRGIGSVIKELISSGDLNNRVEKDLTEILERGVRDSLQPSSNPDLIGYYQTLKKLSFNYKACKNALNLMKNRIGDEAFDQVAKTASKMFRYR